VSFYKLNPTNVHHDPDRLNITVEALYAPFTSPVVEVAKVIAAAPKITSSSNEVTTCDSSIVIKGHGFISTTGTDHMYAFLLPQQGAEIGNVEVISSTRTTLTVTFSNPSINNAGDMRMLYFSTLTDLRAGSSWPLMSSTNSDGSWNSAVWTTVGMIQAAAVSMRAENFNFGLSTDGTGLTRRQMYSSAKCLTIFGDGFDTAVENNQVQFQVDDLTSEIEFPNFDLDSSLANMFNYTATFAESNRTISLFLSSLTHRSIQLPTLPTGTFENYTNTYNISARVIESECTYLVVSFDNIAPMFQGVVTATVSTSGGSANAPVATLIAHPPCLIYQGDTAPCGTCGIASSGPTPSPYTLTISSSSDKLTIKGSGFDRNILSENVAKFVSSREEFVTEWSASNPLGEVVNASSTHLVITFTRLSAQNQGELNATVDVSSQSKHYSWFYDDVRSVAKVVPAVPIIEVTNSTSIELPWLTSQVIIDGSGFDSMGWQYMEIDFMQGEEGDEDTMRDGSVLLFSRAIFESNEAQSRMDQSVFTRNRIQLELQDLYSLELGELYVFFCPHGATFMICFFSFSLSHTHTHTYILSLSLSLSHTHTHTHTYILSLSLSHTHVDSGTCLYVYVQNLLMIHPQTRCMLIKEAVTVIL